MVVKKKRKLTILGKVIMIIFTLGIVLGGCLYCKGTSFDKKISSEGLDNNKETVKDTKQEIEASLVMVGDALIHSAIYEDAYTGSGYDFRSIFVKIKPLLQDYDLKYYNQ